MKKNNILIYFILLIFSLGCRGKITNTVSNNVAVNNNLFTVKSIDTTSLNPYYIFYMYNDKYKSVKVFSRKKQPLPCETPIVIGGFYELKLDTLITFELDTSVNGVFRILYRGLRVVSDTTLLLNIDTDEVVYTTKNFYNDCYKK
jgi:hypothetical protein